MSIKYATTNRTSNVNSPGRNQANDGPGLPFDLIGLSLLSSGPSGDGGLRFAVDPARLAQAPIPAATTSPLTGEHSLGVTLPYLATGVAGSTAATADFAAYPPHSAAPIGLQAVPDVMNYADVTRAPDTLAAPIDSVSGGATTLFEVSALAFATAQSAPRRPDGGDGFPRPATRSPAAVGPSPHAFETSNDTAAIAKLPAVVNGEILVNPPIPSAAASISASDTSALNTSGNFAINLEFDAAAMAAPSSFRTGIEQAASLLADAISVPSPITINIQIEYNENGIAAGSAYAGPYGGEYVAYSTVRSDLIANAAPGDTNFDLLPTGLTIQGQPEVAVWDAQLKAFGILPGTDTALDGLANFSSSINPDALVGVALHELTHALGRVPYGPPDASSPDIFDMFRFTNPGTILIEDQIPATPAYFSVNGGATALADYGIGSDPSDFLNSALTPDDAFNEYYSPGQTFQTLTAVDLTQIDVLGFNTDLSTPRTFDWTGATNSDFGNALNWDDVTDGINPAATPPGAADLAVVNNSGTITGTGTVSALSFTGTNTVAGSLTAVSSLTDNGGVLSVSGALTAASMNVASGAMLSVGAGSSLGLSSPLVVDGTLSTAGTINGGGATEVAFGIGTDRLIVGPSATFGGAVAGGGIDSTIELAAGTGAGTLNALGTNFINFGTVIVDAGATWTVDAASSLLATTEFIGDGASSTLVLTGAGGFSLAGVSRFAQIYLATGNNTMSITDTTLSGGAVGLHDGPSGNNTISAAGDTPASTGKTLTYYTGAGTDSFTGGFENDTVDVSAAAVGGNTLTGGSGTNQLVLTTAGTANLGGASKFGIIYLAAGGSTVTITDKTLSGGTVGLHDGPTGNNSISAAGDTPASTGKTLTYFAGSGTDTFTGGFENDTVDVSAAAVGGDTLTGGSGVNQLALTTPGAANLGGVSKFGIIYLAAGGSTVTIGDKTLSGGTVALHEGTTNNSVSAAGDTSASTGKSLIYYTGSGTDSFTGGFENDTVRVSAAAISGDTLTGGSGANQVQMTTAGTFSLGGVSKFGNVYLVGGNNTVTVTDKTLSGGALSLHAGATGNNSVSAAGDTSASIGKTLSYYTAAGTDTFTGGLENDTVDVRAAQVGGDTLTGGSGTNSLVLTTSGTFSLGGVSKFGIIYLAAGNNTVTVTDKTLSGGALGLHDGASGSNSVSAAGDTSTSTGTTLTYSAGTGTDSFTGGFENDTVNVSAAAVGGDTLTGGSGNNAFNVTTSGTFSLSGVSKFATIFLAAGNNTVTVTDTTLSGGAVTLHDGTNSNNSVTISDTTASLGKTLSYYAGAGTDTFTGGFENDTIYAGTGSGTYTFGLGNDKLMFIAGNRPTQTVNNFNASTDEIVVYGIHATNGFDLGSTDNGLNPLVGTAIDPSIFVADATGSFTSSNQRFAYDTSNGQLFYSATGSNNSESHVATLAGAPAFTASNMLFEH